MPIEMASFSVLQQQNRLKSGVMRKQHGIVLISILIFFAIASLLISYELHAAYLQQHINRNAYQILKTQQVAEYSLKIAYQNLAAGDQQNKTSSFGNIDFHYQLLHLQTVSCIHINDQPASFWQITTTASRKNRDTVKLQAVVAMPSSDAEACSGSITELKSSWQSYRWLAA